MRILIVGAGQVGWVYGAILARGGASVSYFVRPGREKATSAGLLLHRVGVLGRVTSSPFQPDRVFSSWADVAKEAWDAVLVATPSSSLKQPWVEECTSAVGAAPLIFLQLGEGDPAWLGARIPAPRLGYGLIPFMAFNTPGGDGTTYYFPPLTPLLFSGANPESLARLVQAFRKGGVGAGIVRDVVALTRTPEMFLTVAVWALGLVGWKFSAVGGAPSTGACVAAAREVAAIRDHSEKTSLSRWVRFLRPWMIGAALRLMAIGVPLPVERFFQDHFTKVKAQFDRDIEEWIRLGKESALSVVALQELSRLRKTVTL